MNTIKEKPEKAVKLKDFLIDAIDKANDDYVRAVSDKKDSQYLNEVLERRNVLIKIHNICQNRKKF